MSNSKDLVRIAEERRRREETTVQQNLKRIERDESPFQLYTPADDPQKDYLRDLGFPGEYPFTRGTYAVPAVI